jgi:hypothetical protein
MFVALVRGWAEGGSVKCGWVEVEVEVEEEGGGIVEVAVLAVARAVVRMND